MRDRETDHGTHIWKHGVATLVAFVGAGAVPLLPYMMPVAEGQRLSWSVLLTMHRSLALVWRVPL